MKKVGIIIIAVALMITLFLSLGTVWILKKVVTGKAITGESVTGESVSGKATSQQFGLNITLSPLIPNITIDSPMNNTYNFMIYEPFLIDLNVSPNFYADTWWYDLYDIHHDEIAYSNISFWPNTTLEALRWENKLTVYANNSTGYVVNASVDFEIYAPNSLPIISIDPEIFVCEDTALSDYLFNVTDLDEDNTTSLIMVSPEQPEFYVNFNDTVNRTTNAFELFSDILNKTHAGGPNGGYETHSRRIAVFDIALMNFAINYTDIIVIEINHAPNITNPGIQTIYGQGENSTFYLPIFADDIEDGNISSGNLTANISFDGEYLFNITPEGIINYTSNTSEASVNNITVCVSDLGLQNPHQNISLCNQTGFNLSSCINFSLTITDENRPPNITSHWPLNLTFETLGTSDLYFNITSYDPDGTIPDAYWYVDDNFKSYSQGDYLSEFDYTFGCGISGGHAIKAEVTDGLLNDSIQWNITIEEIACPEVPRSRGGGGERCVPKWGCGGWGMCMNLEQALQEGNLSGQEYREIKENCSELGLGEYTCGVQERICKDVNRCFSDYFERIERKECHYTLNPNCNDKIKNCHDGSCELLIDCGGPCTPCPSCSDGIQNQNEEGIDCGGPCPWPCEPEKPAPLPERNLRYGFLLLLIILLLYIMNKTFKIIEKKTKMKKHLVALIFIGVLAIFVIVFLYLYSSVSVGDYVYKKDTKDLIGEVKNKSITLNPLIQWQDGTYSRASVLSIGKVKHLDENEIKKILESNNKQEYQLYSWSPEGILLSEEIKIRNIDDFKEYTIKLEEDCFPSFICGEWSECKVDYTLRGFYEREGAYGAKYRICRDYSECMASFIYSEKCQEKIPVNLEKIKTGTGDSIEIYDLKMNLVARIKRKISEGIEKLEIEIIA